MLVSTNEQSKNDESDDNDKVVEFKKKDWSPGVLKIHFVIKAWLARNF